MSHSITSKLKLTSFYKECNYSITLKNLAVANSIKQGVVKYKFLAQKCLKIKENKFYEGGNCKKSVSEWDKITFIKIIGATWKVEIVRIEVNKYFLIRP